MAVGDSDGGRGRDDGRRDSCVSIAFCTDSSRSTWSHKLDAPLRVLTIDCKRLWVHDETYPLSLLNQHSFLHRQRWTPKGPILSLTVHSSSPDRVLQARLAAVYDTSTALDAQQILCV